MNEGEQIREEFLDEQLMALDISQVRWYADTMNLIVSGEYPPGDNCSKEEKVEP